MPGPANRIYGKVTAGRVFHPKGGLQSRMCKHCKRHLPAVASAGICSEVDLQLSGDLVVNQGEQRSETRALRGQGRQARL